MNLTPYRYHIEKRYRDYFKQIEGMPSLFMDIELVLLLFYRIEKNRDPNEAWTIVTGYPVWGKSLAPVHKRMADHLHLRYRDVFGSAQKWEETLSDYFDVDYSHRLFTKEAVTGEVKMKRPHYDLFHSSDKEKIRLAFTAKDEVTPYVNIPKRSSIRNPRLWVYYLILKGIPKEMARKRPKVSESGKYVYLGSGLSEEMKFTETEKREETSRVLKHDKSVPEEEVSVFPSYKKKQYFARDEKKFDRVGMARKMGAKWEAQASRSLIYKKKKKEGLFVYDGSFSLIAGGVGVGKNAFIEEELYRLLVHEKKEVRAVVVVRTNQSAFDLHETLTKLNIHATVVPGVYSKKNHEQDYLERLLKRGDSFAELLNHTKTLDVADSDCLFQIYHGQKLEEGMLPCLPFNRFRDEMGSEVLCPYYRECGIIRPFLDMLDAPVWITTPYALSKTSLPAFLDPEKRTLQQAVNDLADVVYFDEVDETMSIYDAEAIDETKITGGMDGLNAKFQIGTREILYQNDALYEDVYVTDWQYNLRETDSALFMIYQLIAYNRDAHFLFSNNIMTIHKLGNQFINYFVFESKEEELKYRKTLFRFLSQNEVDRKEITHNRFTEMIEGTMFRLYNENHRKKKREHVEKLFDKLGWRLNSRKNGKNNRFDNAKERAMLVFEIMTYLYLFERHFRQLVSLHPMIQNKFALKDKSINNTLGMRNKLFKLLASTPTGNQYGYRFHKDQKGQQQISLLRYNGQTRQLLTRWSDFFSFFGWKRDADGTIQKVSSPTLVGLSGTAYVPGSPHFHVPTDNVYKLENKLVPSNLTCSAPFIPILHKRADYLFISGTSGDERVRHLREMTESCFEIIEEQLKKWEERGEKRKVLITPTSYEDAKTVALVFSQHPKWKHRFAFLSRDNVGENLTSYAIKPSEVEQVVPKQGVDVLIAPLLVIARGYNILQPGTTKSYFGTMILMTRPYFLVDDMLNHYKLIHKEVDKEIQGLNVSQRVYASQLNRIRQRSQIKLRNLLTKPYYTSSIEKEEMEDLCWYTMVLVQQAIGRMQRGDTDAHLVILDSKMHYHSNSFKERMYKMGKKTSMVNVWKELLERNSDNGVMQQCFGTLKKALDALDLEENDDDDNSNYDKEYDDY